MSLATDLINLIQMLDDSDSEDMDLCRLTIRKKQGYYRAIIYFSDKDKASGCIIGDGPSAIEATKAVFRIIRANPAKQD